MSLIEAPQAAMSWEGEREGRRGREGGREEGGLRGNQLVVE